MKPQHFTHKEWVLMELYGKASRVDGHLAGLQAVWNAAKKTKRSAGKQRSIAARAKGVHRQSVRRARKYGRVVCSFEEFLPWFEQHEADPCAECAKPSSSVDHKHPLSKGGDHVVSNLQRLCGPCNSRKWAWLPGEMRIYSAARSASDDSLAAQISIDAQDSAAHSRVREQ